VVEKGVGEVSALDYLTWTVLAAVGALSSAMMLWAAERRGAHAQAWLATSAFGPWSAAAVLCYFFWEGA
jgi:hypothetical protein